MKKCETSKTLEACQQDAKNSILEKQIKTQEDQLKKQEDKINEMKVDAVLFV